MTPRQQIILALSVPFTVTLAAVLALVSVQPITDVNSPSVETRFDVTRALSDTAFLSAQFPNRVVGSPESARAREWLVGRFADLDLSIETLPFTVTVASQARAGVQVWASVPGASDEAIVVTAHYDTPEHGGRDNAAGAAALLELARIFSSERPRRTLIFMLSDSREYGRAWGARNFVEQRLAAQNVIAALDLDVRSHGAGTQVQVESAGFQFGHAPLWLRQTGLDSIEAAGGQASEAVGAQELIARAFPFDMTEHGMFLRAGIPAIAFSGGAIETSGRAAEIWVWTVDALDMIPASSSGDWRLTESTYLPAWAALFLPLLLFAPLFLAAAFALRSDRPRLQDFRLELTALLGIVIAGADGYAAAFILQAVRLLPRYEWFPAAPGDPFLLQIQDWVWLVIYGVAAVFAWYTFGRPRSWGHLADQLNVPHRRVTLLMTLTALALAAWLMNGLAAALLMLPAAYLWPWIAPRPTRAGRALNMALALGGVLPWIGVFSGVALTPGLGLWWWFLTLGAAYGLYPLPAVLAGIVGAALCIRFIRLGWR
jgi:hypothetical protein